MPQSLVRHIHASRVFHTIRLHPNSSQREIADLAKTDKSTVSAIIRQFEATGLIERSLKKGGTKPGRPGEQISISPDGGLLIGVHPRPDGMLYAAAKLDGEVLSTLAWDIPGEPAAIGKAIAQGLEAVCAKLGRKIQDARAIGVSVQGLINNEGLLTQSPNLGWRDIPLRKLISEHIHRPVYIDNNANAAAAAEYLFGTGIDIGDFAYVESGSGLGAGLFLDGSVYRGHRGFAGEFGHTKVVPQGRLCRCGAMGCLSAYASNYSIIQRLQQKGMNVENAEQVVTLARQGDQTVLDVLNEAGGHLGMGLANLVNLLNIQLFILGGGLALLYPFMEKAISETMREAALSSALAECRIVTSQIGSYERPLGGVALALEGCTSLQEAEATPW